MNRYSVILVLLELLLYVAAKVTLSEYLQGYEIPGLIIIPLVFTLLGSVTISMLIKRGSQGVQFILGVKAVRFMLSMFVIGIYALACREHVLEFVVAYGAFYLTSILFESWMLLDMNKKKKKDKQ